MDREMIQNENLPQEEYVLDIQDLVVHYELEEETVEAVNGVSIRLKKGQTLGLVGETGAGKTSTCLSVLNLVQTPPGVIKSGTVKVCGANVLEMTPKELEQMRGKDVSMIFQDPMTALNPVMTVGDQIAESIHYHEGLSGKECMDRAIEILEMVGIPGVRGVEYPHQFSGGMKQRVVIAMALACNPELLLADEPTGNVDDAMAKRLLHLFLELNKLGTTVVVATHNMELVKTFQFPQLHLNHGKLELIPPLSSYTDMASRLLNKGNKNAEEK